MAEINSKIPEGPLADKWTNYKDHQKLVNPASQSGADDDDVEAALVGGVD